MTAEQFENWWYAQSTIGTTSEQREAWREFLNELGKELGHPVPTIQTVPPHARDQFMAVHALIFG